MSILRTYFTRALPYFGFAGYFFTLFFFFAYLTFPYDKLRDYVVARANSHEASGERRELRIGELSLRPLLGVRLEDVEVRRFDGPMDKEPSILRADLLKVSASVWSLLTGSASYDFSGEVKDGTFEGSYSQDGDDVHISAEIEDLDLAAAGIGSALDFPLAGKLSGEVELSLPKDAALSEGSIHLTIANLTLGDGKAKLKIPGMRDGMTVERVDAGTLKVDCEIAKGTATLREFSTDGKDLVLNGSGDVKLASPSARSRLNLALQFRFSEGYKSRDAKTKALFDLMAFRPELKRATTHEGDLRFELRGLLASPRATPAGRGGATRGK